MKNIKTLEHVIPAIQPHIGAMKHRRQRKRDKHVATPASIDVEKQQYEGREVFLVRFYLPKFIRLT